MHNAAFRYMGIDAVYLAFDVTDISSALAGVRSLGISGLSVTVPHKEAVLVLLDEVDDTAKSIGAVNTVINRDGILTGANTDWLGAVRALSGRAAIEGKRALVVGAGGSARAVVAGLSDSGAEVHIANRTVSRAQKLAGLFKTSWCGLEDVEDVFREEAPDILVNTTTVGMAPDDRRMPVPPVLLEMMGEKGGVVMDIVYSPRETLLLKEAERCGCSVIDGLQMLLFQAVEQFEMWTGADAPVDVMRRALEEMLAK
jgi:shikimate dehydrogenase